MEEIVAPVGTVVFDLERDLDQQIGALPLPFGGMDKSGSATCVFHLKGFCNRASMCPFRHIKPDRTIVCKHWLRGLCKKGDSCEFLHEYDMSKMPECYFYSKFRACSNKECPFLHIDPESKIKDCPWYDRGFCRHGPMCRHRHTRRVCCINYLCGFCPDGPACKFVHMRFDIPMLGPPGGPPGATTGPGMLTLTPSMMPNTNGNMITSIGGGGPDSGPGHGGAGHTGPLLTINPNQPGNMMDGRPDRGPKPKGVVICHYCQEPGHKIYVCNAIPPDQRDEVIQKFLLEQQESRKNHQRYGGRGDSGHGGAGGDHHGGGHKDHHNHHSNRENFHPYQRHQNHNAPGGGGHHHNNRQQQPLLLSTIDNNNDSGSQTSENSTTFGSSISTVVGVGGATGPGGPGAGGIGLKEPLLTVPGGGPPLLTVGVPGGRRPLDQVTCFKCGEKGHYANKCPKGYLAFLSPALGNLKRAEPDS